MRRLVFFITASFFFTLAIIVCANTLNIQTPGFVGIIATMFLLSIVVTGFNFSITKIFERYKSDNLAMIIAIPWLLATIALEALGTFIIWQPTRASVQMSFLQWFGFTFLSNTVFLCLFPFYMIVLAGLCVISPKFKAFLVTKGKP